MSSEHPGGDGNTLIRPEHGSRGVDRRNRLVLDTARAITSHHRAPEGHGVTESLRVTVSR